MKGFFRVRNLSFAVNANPAESKFDHIQEEAFILSCKQEPDPEGNPTREHFRVA